MKTKDSILSILALGLSVILVPWFIYSVIVEDLTINLIPIILIGFSSFVFTRLNIKNKNRYYALSTLLVSLGCFIIVLLTIFSYYSVGSFSSLESLGFAAANTNDDSEELVNVTLYEDEDQVIMSQVPKIYEQEYLSKLEDSNFRNAEIQKSLGANTDFEKAGPQPFISYMKKAEVVKR